MHESIDFSKPDLAKEEFKPQYNELVDKLVVLQQKARQEGIGLVVLFEGMMEGGRGRYISDLMYNLDARATSVYLTNPADDNDVSFARYLSDGVLSKLPIMAEYWQHLGQRSDFTFFDGGWYSRYVSLGLRMLQEAGGFEEGKENDAVQISAARKEISRLVALNGTASASEFERTLTDDGYLVAKFFNCVSYKGMKKTCKKMSADKTTNWMMHGFKKADKKTYKVGQEFFDELLELSDFDFCPWVVLNGDNRRESELIVVSTLVRKLEEALAAKHERDAKIVVDEGGQKDLASYAPKTSRFDIVAKYPHVDQLDHSLMLTREEYKKQLKPLQERLGELQYEARRRHIPVLVTFEGWDAAGKGGSIKRIAQALDARMYTIFPSPAPTKVELGHPHLWRYWTRLPEAGYFGLYDRTWYGRVLVERIEGFATPERWAQAYDEINAFEQDLVNWGAVLIKFWVDISTDEQLKRFEARQADPDKQWKITEEDWRNREKYPEYKAAVDDMFRLTSTTFAPWTVLESESKYYARVKALKTVVEALEERLAQ